MQLWCMGIKHFFPHVWFLSFFAFLFECYHVLHMIRSMLGPISTQKATNSAKSKKSFNTRQTRSSRRTAPKNLLEENTNGNSVITRSTLALLLFKGLATKHTTEKWTIIFSILNWNLESWETCEMKNELKFFWRSATFCIFNQHILKPFFFNNNQG